MSDPKWRKADIVLENVLWIEACSVRKFVIECCILLLKKIVTS